jgi:hypothetical protein
LPKKREPIPTWSFGRCDAIGRLFLVEIVSEFSLGQSIDIELAAYNGIVLASTIVPSALKIA